MMLTLALNLHRSLVKGVTGVQQYVKPQWLTTDGDLSVADKSLL